MLCEQFPAKGCRGMGEAFLVGGVRTPVGRYGGVLVERAPG